MGKTLNKRGKFGRAGIKDRSMHWKAGKSMGPGTYQERKLRKAEKRGKKD